MHSHLADELHLRLLRVFGGPQVFKAFSQGQRLIVRLILAAEDTPQEGDVGQPLSDWAGGSGVALYPKRRLVCLYQVNLLQGVVRLRPEDTGSQESSRRPHRPEAATEPWELLQREH